MTKKSTKKKTSGAKGPAVLVRLSEEDFERLKKLAASLSGRMPFLTNPSLAHAAILIGLAEIERDPAALLPKVGKADG